LAGADGTPSCFAIPNTIPNHGRRKGGKAPWIVNLLAKQVFFQFRGVKTTTFGPPEKIFGNSPAGPPWKISFPRPCTQPTNHKLNCNSFTMSIFLATWYGVQLQWAPANIMIIHYRLQYTGSVLTRI